MGWNSSPWIKSRYLQFVLALWALSFHPARHSSNLEPELDQLPGPHLSFSPTPSHWDSWTRQWGRGLWRSKTVFLRKSRPGWRHRQGEEGCVAQTLPAEEAQWKASPSVLGNESTQQVMSALPYSCVARWQTPTSHLLKYIHLITSKHLLCAGRFAGLDRWWASLLPGPVFASVARHFWRLKQMALAWPFSDLSSLSLRSHPLTSS